MKKRTKVIVLIMAGIAVVAITACVLESPQWIAGIHQRGVTRELAEWEKEHSHFTNLDEAENAVGVMRQVEHYYVPADGYHSSETIEHDLAQQRQKTLEAIGRGLEAYTGERFGTDIDKWEKWRAAMTPQK